CRFRRPNAKAVIEIETRQPDAETLEIRVSDNGSGVDVAGLNKIFLPFQRMHSRQEYPGFGLGLALCDKIVSVYGGTINATASASGGLTVSMTLPLAEKPQRAG